MKTKEGPKDDDGELKDAVNDLFAHMEHHERQTRKKNEKQKNKTDSQPLVFEPLIAADELVPLGDLKSSLPAEKSLLNARVIFVIGK